MRKIEMKHIKLFEEISEGRDAFNEYQKINEDTSSTFTIKGVEIEIFATSEHRKEANKIYKALVDAGLEDRYFSIIAEVK